MNRIEEITANLPLKTGRGLEISPLFRPILSKATGKVDYTDYLPTEQLREREKAHPDVANLVDIDFVWTPGSILKDCVDGRAYDYVVSSHVLEHVPNPLGWLEQQLDVCRIGAIISMAVPTKFDFMDLPRDNTTFSEWIAAYVEDRRIPSAQQIFDCLYHSRPSLPVRTEERFTKEQVLAMPSGYTPEQAMGWAHRAVSQKVYTDVHCSVFTPDSVRNLLQSAIDIGLLNVEILDIHTPGLADPRDVAEFYIKLRKMPLGSSAARWNGQSPYAKLNKEWGPAMS